MKNILGWSLLAVSVGMAGCNADKPTDRPEASEKVLPVTRIAARDTVLLHEYVGDIQAVRNVEIRARVPGFLDKIYVDEGQEVRKGQPLFGLNDEEYRAELAKARANRQSAIAEAKAAELELDRVRLLVDKKVISKTELDVARTKLNAAHARIEEARSAEANAAIRLSYAHVKAPFDGIIDRIPLKTGSLVEEGTLLTSVSDNRAVFTYFNVSEGEYLEYVKARQGHPGRNSREVTLVLADGSTYPHPGKIETMEGEFDASTGSIAFRARFPNPDKLLKHGATGTVRLANRIDDALIVPQKAVFEIQDKNYVYVVDDNNRVTMKNFVPKARFSHFYIVESGLKPGERIVYEGIQNVKDGLQIVPHTVTLDSLLAKAR
jgi:membrane fusion protein (multidrug efflux system)